MARLARIEAQGDQSIQLQQHLFQEQRDIFFKDMAAAREAWEREHNNRVAEAFKTQADPDVKSLKVVLEH